METEVKALRFVLEADEDCTNGMIDLSGDYKLEHNFQLSSCDNIDLSLYTNNDSLVGTFNAALLPAGIDEYDLAELVGNYNEDDEPELNEFYKLHSSVSDGVNLIVYPSYINPQYRGHHIMKAFIDMIKDLSPDGIENFYFTDYTLTEKNMETIPVVCGKYSVTHLISAARSNNTRLPEGLKSYFSLLTA